MFRNLYAAQTYVISLENLRGACPSSLANLEAVVEELDVTWDEVATFLAVEDYLLPVTEEHEETAPVKIRHAMQQFVEDVRETTGMDVVLNIYLCEVINGDLGHFWLVKNAIIPNPVIATKQRELIEKKLVVLS